MKVVNKRNRGFQKRSKDRDIVNKVRYNTPDSTVLYRGDHKLRIAFRKIAEKYDTQKDGQEMIHSIKWGNLDQWTCPICGHGEYRPDRNRYYCLSCHKRSSIFTGTILKGCRLYLPRLIQTIFLVANFPTISPGLLFRTINYGKEGIDDDDLEGEDRKQKERGCKSCYNHKISLIRPIVLQDPLPVKEEEYNKQFYKVIEYLFKPISNN